MPNFFNDNKDLVFQFERLDLREVVETLESNYDESAKFDYAPKNYEDAVENFRKVMELIGDISANNIAPRAADVDEQGAICTDGKVEYADGTKLNLRDLAQAEVMGMTLPRRFGGLNLPSTLYMMATEMVSRADCGLMNLFGLQDIAATINKFASEDQRAEYLPGFCTGEFTGAMALTEPDAGSDLQAVKLTAYQDKDGAWKLKGVKRFITNGNGGVLLVLARSEDGTRDGRGLSMFACYGDDTIKIRRIEHKMGIKGSPTCEMQFNDTPCVLVGDRKMGLIKYVMYLMNRARLGIGAQSLGVMQAAYEEARKYASEREQFGKPILNIPAVANILMDMKVSIEAGRSMYYQSCQWLDAKDALEDQIDRLKAEGKPFAEANNKVKEATKLLGFLTPLAKYVLSEGCNRLAYDAIQIHGGTGFMKEFPVERLYRDARITSIYEGTSQLQIVAAIGGVVKDVLASYFDEHEQKSYKESSQPLAEVLKEMRVIFNEAKNYVVDKKDSKFQDLAAKDLVDMYGDLYTGYLILDEAEVNERKSVIARRFILESLARARKSAETIKSEALSDLQNLEMILD